MMGLFTKSKDVSIQDVKLNFNKGNYKKALKLCKDLLKNKDRDFELLNVLGDIYYKIGDKNNSLDTFRKVISYLENDRYIDRAIAVIKKVIRIFPDQYDLYRKLSKLFEMKGLSAEQLKILYELSNIYQSNGLEDKAIDILKEIVEVDRSNLNNYVEILKKFDDLGKKFEISKIIYPALELAYNKKDENAIEIFTEIALKNKVDLKDSIKFTTSYFKKHKDLIGVFNNYAKESLESEFDKLLFKELVSLNSFSSISELVLSLKDKYQEMVIYDYLLEQYVLSSDISTFIELLNEINSLPDYLFDSSYSEVVGKHLNSIMDVDALDLMVTIAGKCSAKDLQISIYKKLSDIYKSQNDDEKANRIIQYINELEYQDVGITTEINSIDDLATENTEADDSLSDLLETTSHVEDEESFDLDLDSDEDDGSISNEIGLEANVSDEVEKEEFSLDLGSDVAEDSMEFELDLDTEVEDIFEDNVDINKHEDKETQDYDNDFDIEINEDDEIPDIETEEIDLDDFTDESIFELDSVDVVEESNSLENEINEIKLLIENNKSDIAKEKINLLLKEYPDDDDLNELSSLIQVESNDKSQDALRKPKDDESDTLSDLIYSFRTVVDNIRSSIDAQVSLDDYETHYDLAMAYMEMELFDEAIEELKKSATANKKYESLFLMAECYKRMGQYDDAIGIHKLIVIDFKDQEKLKNSLYEIAIISEMQGDNNSSMNFLQKISRLDPDFRDVKSRLNGIVESETLFNEQDKFKLESSNDDAPAKMAKKKKISFL